MPFVNNDDGNFPDERNISSNKATNEKKSESAEGKKEKKRDFNLFSQLRTIAFFALAIKHLFLGADDHRWSLGYRSIDLKASLIM